MPNINDDFINPEEEEILQDPTVFDPTTIDATVVTPTEEPVVEEEPVLEEPQAEEPVLEGEDTPKEDLSFLDGILDVGEGLAGGVEAFGRDFIGLVELFGLDSPISRENQLFTADTAVGKFAQEIVNFGLGFAAVGGIGGAALKAVQSVRPLASTAAKLKRIADIDKARKTGVVPKGLEGTNVGIDWGLVMKDTAKGAIVDFGFYHEKEEQLTDILSNHGDVLEPHVSEYMAGETTDADFGDRLKFAMEGAALGFGFDLLFQGARALKAARRAAEEGASPERVARILDREEAAITKELSGDDALLRPTEVAEVTEEEADEILLNAVGGDADRLEEIKKKAKLGEAGLTEVTGTARPFGTTRDTKARNSRSDKKIVDEVIFQLRGDGVVEDEEISEVVEALRPLFADPHSAQIRGTGQRFDNYILGIVRALESGLDAKAFGSAQMDEVSSALIRGLRPQQLEALERYRVLKKQELIDSVTDDPRFEGIFSEFGVDTQVSGLSLAERNLSVEEVNEFLPQFDRLSDNERTLAHLVLGQLEDVPDELKSVIPHGQKVIDGIADVYELRFGTARTKEIFSPEKFTTENLVPGNGLSEKDLVGAALAQVRHPTLKAAVEELGPDDLGEGAWRALRQLDEKLRQSPNDPGAIGKFIRNNFGEKALNLRNFRGAAGSVRLVRTLEKLYGMADTRKVPLSEDEARGLELFLDNVDPANRDAMKAQLFPSAETLREQGDVDRATFLAAKHAFELSSQRVSAELNRYEVGDLSEAGVQKLADLLVSLNDLNELRRTVTQWKTNAGRMLNLGNSNGLTARDRSVSDKLLEASGRKVPHRPIKRRGPDATDAEVEGGSHFDVIRETISDAEIDDANNLAQADEIIRKLGGRKKANDMIKDLQMALKASGNPFGLAKQARLTLDNPTSTFGSVVSELWYNSMLSSLRTFNINAVSSYGYALGRTMEIALGSVWQGPRGRESLAMAKAEMMELTLGLRDFFKYFRGTFDSEVPTLLPGSGVVDEALGAAGATGATSRGAINAQNLNFKEGSFLGNMFDSVGRIVRFPTRGLMAADDAIKRIQYRATTKARIARDLQIKNGLDSKAAYAEATRVFEDNIRNGAAFSKRNLYAEGEALAREAGIPEGQVDGYAKQFVRDAEDAADAAIGGQQGSFAAISEEGIADAKQVTFTDDLARRGFFSPPQKLADAAANNWFIRIAAPFVRTPTNLALATIDHIEPMGLARMLNRKIRGKDYNDLRNSKELYARFTRDMISGDTAKQAEAYGRLMFGYSVGLSIMAASEAGFITGGGPTDPAKKAAWRDAGFRPYSFRTADGSYLSYERFDPIANLLGIAADIAQGLKLAPEYSDQEADDALSLVAVSVANNFANKTYTRGLADFLGAIGDPAENSEAILARLVGSGVPTILADAGKALDPYEREVRGFADRLQARLPGFRENLPIMRDMLGRPVNKARSIAEASSDGPLAELVGMATPIAFSSVEGPLNEELLKIGYGFSPPTPTYRGVDLRDEEDPEFFTVYDRFTSIIPQVEIGGKKIDEALLELVRSERYQRIPPESTDDITTPRVDLINRLRERFYKKARVELLKQVPSLREKTVQLARQKRARLLGVDITGV